MASSISGVIQPHTYEPDTGSNEEEEPLLVQGCLRGDVSE